MDITYYKTLHKKEILKTPYFRVEQHEIIRPDKTQSSYYILKRGGPFSIIIPVNEKEETYLVGQYRYSIGKVSWEFPMGFVPKISPLAIAKQELIEETGLRAKKWRAIGWFHVAVGYTDQKGFVFEAKLLRQGISEPESGEFLKVRKVPLSTIPNLIKTKTITDGPSITAWQLYAR